MHTDEVKFTGLSSIFTCEPPSWCKPGKLSIAAGILGVQPSDVGAKFISGLHLSGFDIEELINAMALRIKALEDKKM